MSLLTKGAEWLERQRHAYLAVDMEYQRDAVRLPLRATIGQTIFEVSDEYGRLIRIESRDFLIRACDLIIDDQVVTPQVGDLIHEGDFTYEVMSPSGEPEWRYSDINRQTLRIHTKQV
ncbi:MAG: hypothetical protein PVH19_15515 [Planctomycetia bacterium]|jgi:hypothetical protein